MTKRFELRLCSNGSYYAYENGNQKDYYGGNFDEY